MGNGSLKKWGAAVSLVATMALLAACGGTPSSSGTSTANSTPASSSSAPASSTPAATTTNTGPTTISETAPTGTIPTLAVVEAVSSKAPYTITVANLKKQYHANAQTLPVAAAWPSSDAGVLNHVTFTSVEKVNGKYTYPAAPVIAYVVAANGDAVAPGTASSCSGSACAAPATLQPLPPTAAFPSAGLSQTDNWEAISATSTGVVLEVADANGNIVQANGKPYTLDLSSSYAQAFKSSNGSDFPFTKMVLNTSGKYCALYALQSNGTTYYAVVDLNN